MNRIFISYRTSDAKKDAHRLAVDLERIFGDEQVFFDKHDLRGGAAWRESIGQALGERPVVLVVMTPDLKRLGVQARDEPESGKDAGANLGGLWMVFAAAILLWLIVAIGAHEETDPDTYTGAAVVMLFPLGMFIWCFRRLRAAQRPAQWGALGMAVLTGVMVLGYVQLAVEGTGHAVGSYRPPVTSITAPVV